MKISIDAPRSISLLDLKDINQVAALGFGQELPEDMLADTTTHVGSADYIQRTYDETELVGFALYKRCLWRPSN